MLEVATSTELAGDVPERVSTEYLRSKAFCEFVTSALHQHTDLPINMDNVAISGEVVDDRCVVIKTTYHHRDEDTRVTLPDRTVITLKNGDTIRLYISRKYAPAALHGELGRSVWGSRAPPTPPGPYGEAVPLRAQLMLLGDSRRSAAKCRARPVPPMNPARRSGWRSLCSRAFLMTRRIIVVITAVSLAAAFVINAIWFVRSAGSDRLEPVVGVLGILAGITGLVAERWAAAREARDAAIHAIGDELRANSDILGLRGLRRRTRPAVAPPGLSAPTPVRRGRGVRQRLALLGPMRR